MKLYNNDLITDERYFTTKKINRYRKEWVRSTPRPPAVLQELATARVQPTPGPLAVKQEPVTLVVRLTPGPRAVHQEPAILVV